MDSALLNILIAINLIGLIQSVSLAIGLITARKRQTTNTLLALLLLSIAIALGNTILHLREEGSSLFLFQNIANACALTLGPLIWLITTFSLSVKIAKRSIYFHFLPFALFLVFRVSLFLIDSNNETLYWVNRLDSISMFWFFNLQFLAYLIFSLKRINQAQVKKKSDAYWFKKLIFYFVVIIGINFGIQLANRFIISIPEVITLNVTVLLSFVVALIVYKSQRNPISRVSKPLSTHKEDIETLITLVEGRSFYKNQELNISTLSQEMNLSGKTLSSLINTEFGKNFNEFINEYRIKEVIKRLQNGEHEQVTIMAIAKDSGFKSNTAFYRAFKAFTGSTPKEYLRTMA